MSRSLLALIMATQLVFKPFKYGLKIKKKTASKKKGTRDIGV